MKLQVKVTRRDAITPQDISGLTDCNPVTAYDVNELSHQWFKWWLVAWSAPSHYLNQYWLNIDCALVNSSVFCIGNTKFSHEKIHLNMSSANWWPFCSSPVNLAYLCSSRESGPPGPHLMVSSSWSIFVVPYFVGCVFRVTLSSKIPRSVTLLMQQRASNIRTWELSETVTPGDKLYTNTGCVLDTRNSALVEI